MWKRFVRWIRRVFFSTDDSPDEGTTQEDTSKSKEKIDVSSCEVVSIVFEEDEEDKEDKSDELFDFIIDDIEN